MTQRPLSSSHRPPLSEAYWLGRWFTAARREGLLALLPADAWHTLSAILSFTCRDGRRCFTVDQLAVALGLSREQASERLDQLTQTNWHGQPLATLEQDPQGEIVGAILASIDPLTGDRAPVPPEPADDEKAVSAVEQEVSADDLEVDLRNVGLKPDQIDWLLHRFPRARLRRQLDWLPQRQARNPAALLLRAVEQDWGPPREAA
jgi:hypothetical protein